MSGVASQGPLEVAEVVLRTDLIASSVRARLAAAFARQALEVALRERFGIAAGARVPLRALLAHARMQAPDLGREADVVWLHLTWACHQRPEEVDPDLATVSSLVEDVRKIIG